MENKERRGLFLYNPLELWCLLHKKNQGEESSLTFEFKIGQFEATRTNPTEFFGSIESISRLKSIRGRDIVAVVRVGIAVVEVVLWLWGVEDLRRRGLGLQSGKKKPSFGNEPQYNE